MMKFSMKQALIKAFTLLSIALIAGLFSESMRGFESKDPGFSRRGFQIDLGRQIERIDVVESWLPKFAEWGYNTIFLYLEDGIVFPSHPEISRPHSWRFEDTLKFVEKARSYGIDTIPCVPSFGHTAYILKVKKYEHLSETREFEKKNQGHICPSLEETYQLFSDLYQDVSELATSGYIHMSLDESYIMGKCSLCNVWVEKEGEGQIFLTHLKRLSELVRKTGKRPAIWGDMLYYYPEIIAQIPKDVAVFDWFYYPFKSLPRVEIFNFEEIDSAGRLKKAGLEVWGCSNTISSHKELFPSFKERFQNVKSWRDYGQRVGCWGILNTSWEGKYSSYEYNVIVNAAVSGLLSSKDLYQDDKELMRKGLERVYGEKDTSLADLWLRFTEITNSGYYAWQSYKSDFKKLVRFTRQNEEKKAADLSRLMLKKLSGKDLPALQLAAQMRLYLAEKLIRINEAALFLKNGRFKKARERLRGLEPLMKKAKQLSEQQWQRWRYADDHNPIVKILNEDSNELRRVLERLNKGDASVLLPPSQVQIEVVNFAPALQGIEVYYSKDGKIYQLLHRMWLIEFREEASYPKADIRRIHYVNLPENSDSFYLKIRCVGFGQFGISSCLWTDGTRRVKPSKVMETKGRCEEPEVLLGKVRGMCKLGDSDPKAQYLDRTRKESAHEVELAFEFKF